MHSHTSLHVEQVRKTFSRHPETVQSRWMMVKGNVEGEMKSVEDGRKVEGLLRGSRVELSWREMRHAAF